jgi:peptidoglycan/xylan/chitin deacetylase (PgdA/CDA1 family)
MRYAAIVLGCVVGIGPALAEPCPGNPNAIGTSRTVVVDGAKLPFIGTMHYQTSVPLEDHEVLLTFDDGPRPPYTDRILDALAAECVKATFFMVGYMVRANPQTVRRVYNEGHSIGSHSQNHPVTFGSLGLPGIMSEVGGGFATITAALGDPRAVSTFFRAPGLAQNRWLNGYLAARATSLWSTDTHAWDWSGISAAEIARRALAQLDAKGGRGVVLLHDLQPATALAMPMLLRQLREHGYRIVHAVPPGERPTSVPEPKAPAAPLVAEQGWPRTLPAPVNEPDKALTERNVPARAEGRGALPPAVPSSMNAAMKPAMPDRKQAEPAARDPDVTNSVPKKPPATHVARRRPAMPQQAKEWTLFGGWKAAQR